MAALDWAVATALKGRDLTDAEWESVAHFMVRPKTRGRPARDPRAVLNGILWILRNRAPWRALPAHYGSWQTVYACYRSLQRAGRLREILGRLNVELPE